MLDPARWQLFAGSWKHSPGRLEQQLDGQRRAALRLLQQPPQDFDVLVRFTILGGSQYRSVGLSFDASNGDPTVDTAADYHEHNVYISGQSPGSKIHAAWNAGGRWNYPPFPAVRNLPITLGTEYTLRVQVRGKLLNASLNGLQLLAAAEVTEVEHRAQAWRAVWQNAEQPARAETHATAVRALRRKAVATAGHALAVARRDQQRATADRAAAAAPAHLLLISVWHATPKINTTGDACRAAWNRSLSGTRCWDWPALKQ